MLQNDTNNREICKFEAKSAIKRANFFQFLYTHIKKKVFFAPKDISDIAKRRNKQNNSECQQ
jgi:hypothetical protein